MIAKATVTAALIAIVGVLGLDAYTQGMDFVATQAATEQANLFARSARLHATLAGRDQLTVEDLAAAAAEVDPEHLATAPRLEGDRLVLDSSVEGECRAVSIGALGEPVVGNC